MYITVLISPFFYMQKKFKKQIFKQIFNLSIDNKLGIICSINKISITY